VYWNKILWFPEFEVRRTAAAPHVTANVTADAGGDVQVLSSHLIPNCSLMARPEVQNRGSSATYHKASPSVATAAWLFAAGFAFSVR